MEYRDIFNAFREKFGVEESKFIFDVRETCPMIFHIDGREILGSVFRDEILFYELIE